MTLQKSKRLRISETWGSILSQYHGRYQLHLGFFRKSRHHMNRLFAQVKQLMDAAHFPGIFPRVNGKRHCDLPRKLHQFPQKLLLNRRESRKPVQQNCTSP